MIGANYRFLRPNARRNPAVDKALGILGGIGQDFWQPIAAAGEQLGDDFTEARRASERRLLGNETGDDKRPFADHLRTLGLVGDAGALALSPLSGAMNTVVGPASRLAAKAPFPIYEEKRSGPFALAMGDEVVDPKRRAAILAQSMNTALMGLAPGKGALPASTGLAKYSHAAPPAPVRTTPAAELARQEPPALAAPERPALIPREEQFPPAAEAGVLWKMNREELQELLAQTQARDADSLLRAFGDAGAVKEFNRLDRARNNTWDNASADAASAEFDAKYGNLTPEQERLVYGIGESGASPDDIKAVLREHQDWSQFHDADLVDTMASAIRSNPRPASFMRVREGLGRADEQAQFLRFGGAFQEATARGMDMSRLGVGLVNSLERAGYGKRADIEEIISGFVEALRSEKGRVDQPRLGAPQQRRLGETGN
jgi:hypothetical protein